MPAKPSGGTATALSNVAVARADGQGTNYSNGSISQYTFTLPSGGQWRYLLTCSGGASYTNCGTIAGGSSISLKGTSNSGGTVYKEIIAIRVS